MTEEIFRNYLEINSLSELNEVKVPSNNYSLDLVNPKDFHLNNIECLKVDLAIDNQDMFIKQVLKVYD